MLTTGPDLGLLDNGEYGEQVYHELLRLTRGIDLLVQPHVKSRTVATPPTTPAEGDSYIVPADATGAWEDKTDKVARWTARSAAGEPQWEFFTPKINWSFGVDDDVIDPSVRFNGTAWTPFVVPFGGAQQLSNITYNGSTSQVSGYTVGGVAYVLTYGPYGVETITGGGKTSTFTYDGLGRLTGSTVA